MCLTQTLDPLNQLSVSDFNGIKNIKSPSSGSPSSYKSSLLINLKLL